MNYISDFYLALWENKTFGWKSRGSRTYTWSWSLSRLPPGLTLCGINFLIHTGPNGSIEILSKTNCIRNTNIVFEEINLANFLIYVTYCGKPQEYQTSQLFCWESALFVIFYSVLFFFCLLLLWGETEQKSTMQPLMRF